MDAHMARSTAPETGPGHATERAAAEPGWEAIKRLRWFMTLVPAVGVFMFETVRHRFLDYALPTWEGNLVAAFVALAFGFAFSETVLRVVERLHRRSLADQEELICLTAVVQERERLSRELHDGLAQLVSYLLLRLDIVGELIRSNRMEEAQAELVRLRVLTDDLYADVRESISGLRSRVVELGLRRALEDYIEEFEERHGLTVAFTAPVDINLPPSVELQLFRIGQEALANVRKHSGESCCEMVISYPSIRELELVVSDHGRGFDPDRIVPRTSKPFGLAGIQERAEALGGTALFESELGGGTRVIIRIPLPNQ
jgi:signal transduction histidine kinase